MGFTFNKKAVPAATPALKPKGSRTKAKYIKKHNWEALREEFLFENLQPGRIEAFNTAQLAERHGLSPTAVCNYATLAGWREALEELQQQIREQRQRQLIAATNITEVEIRSKQARYASLAMDKAILRLQSVNPMDLSIKEATKLLELGLTEERRAYGLVESVQVMKNVDQNAGAQGHTKQLVDRATSILQAHRERMTLRLVNGGE
jgi:hypothetical protein